MRKSAKSAGKGWRFIELFLAAVFLFSAAMLIREGSRYFRERKEKPTALRADWEGAGGIVRRRGDIVSICFLGQAFDL